MTRVLASGETLLIALALFFVGFAVHESAHVLVIHAVGSQGSLIVRPWRFATMDLTLPSLHAQPNPPLDTVRQAIVNFSGPVIAALLFALSLVWIRNPNLRVAVGANIVILAFYAVIETAYLVLFSAFRIDPDLLATPEFNYGVPALIIVIAAVARGLERPPRPATDRR